MLNKKETKNKICFVLQQHSPGTHMDYVYEMARTLREDEGLPLTLLIEKSSSANAPDWVISQKFCSLLPRVVENFYLLLKFRLSGHRIFYIHYSFLSAISASIITKILGGTVYYWNAGMPWQYKRPWYKEWYQKLAYKLIDVLVTGAEALVDGYSSHYKIAKDKIKVIPNWIDLSEVKLDPLVRSRVRTELNIPKEAPTLLFVQKLSRRKGAHFLPKIFDRLVDSHIHLIIAGDGPEENVLHTWAKSNLLTANIHFTGRVDRNKMKELYQTADIFLLPSEEEGSPHSLIEAMAYQLPFVGFAVGGVQETVPEELRQYLCTFSDVSALVDKVRTFLQDKATQSTVSVLEKQWVMKFNKPLVTKQFVDLLS